MLYVSSIDEEMTEAFAPLGTAALLFVLHLGFGSD